MNRLAVSVLVNEQAGWPAKCVECGLNTCKRSIHSEPPRSPYLTPCDLFLWVYVKDHVFIPPMPLDLAELQQRIEQALAGIDH